MTLSDGSRSQDIKDGIRDVLPILPAIFPFGGVFGALAVEQGLSSGEVFLASMTIFAGASQYAMLDLMGQNVPAWSIVLAVFAVNFRHVLYSASLARKLAQFKPWQRWVGMFLLVDPQFATADTRAATHGLRPAYFFASGLLLYSNWLFSNAVGAQFGALLENPADYGLDFILPIYFAGLVMGFHKRPRFLPILLISTAVSLVTYHTIGSPWHISIGGVAGLILAAILSKPPVARVDG